MGNDGGDGEFYGVVVLVAQVPFPNSHCELARKEAGKSRKGGDLFFQFTSSYSCPSCSGPL